MSQALCMAWQGRGRNKRVVSTPVPTPHPQIHSQMRRTGHPETSNLNTGRILASGINSLGLVWVSLPGFESQLYLLWPGIFLKFPHLFFFTCKIGINKTIIMWDIGKSKWGDLCVGLCPSLKLPEWNLKLPSIQEGQAETKERGRWSRWQF